MTAPRRQLRWPRMRLRPLTVLVLLVGAVLTVVVLPRQLHARPESGSVAALSAAAPPPAACLRTKVESGGLSLKPRLMCEVTPGKWVEVNPDHPPPTAPPTSSPSAPSQKPSQNPSQAPSQAPQQGKKCPGRQKIVSQPGMPMPDLMCEVAPGKWQQDPASPYKIENPAPAPKCGLLDVGCKAKEAVTDWFRDLVKSATKPTFKFLSATVLGTPEISSVHMERARQMWHTSQLIANTCFVLMVTIAGILLMAGQSMPGELTIKEVLPRVVLAFLAVNLSLLLVGYAITFANGLAKAFLSAGTGKIDPAQAGRVMANGIEATINTSGIFFILVALVAIILALMVAFIYVARLAITMVLIAAAPLALMFHALPTTDGLARLWWRGISGMLAIQVLQALVFITALQLLFNQHDDRGSTFVGIPNTKADLIDLLLIICLLFVMVRIPSWVARTIWRPAQPRILSQLVKTFVIYRTAGTVIHRLTPGKMPKLPRR